MNPVARRQERPAAWCIDALSLKGVPMTRSRSFSLLSVVLVLLATVSWLLLGYRPVATPASAVLEPRPTGPTREGVLVSGTGEVLAVPDTLRAVLGVRVRAGDVGEALGGANAAMTRMRNVLVREGVAPADLQTSQVDIESVQNDAGQVTGYTVSESLTAKIRSIPRAGTILAAAVAAGGNAARLSGVSFVVERNDALLAEARRKAFADARAKAELYADEADRSLGDAAYITETAPGDTPLAQGQAVLADAAPAVPIEPGRQPVAVTVTIRWSFR